MLRSIVYIVCLVVLFGCQQKAKTEPVEEDSTSQMYEPSEMAILMRQMQALNEQAKKQIQEGKDVAPFSDDLLAIHSAVMTDPDDRDREFDSLAIVFLDYQKNTFGPHNSQTKVNFNQSIKTCITCHETRCTGPIPMIKKLLID